MISEISETTKEILRIDTILDQLDELLATLPQEYQESYADELMNRFDLVE